MTVDIIMTFKMYVKKNLDNIGVVIMERHSFAAVESIYVQLWKLKMYMFRMTSS